MTIFNWLLLGHVVGDWLLQNEWMASGKRGGLITLSGMAHFLIYTGVVLGHVWLSGAAANDPALYPALALAIFVPHWLIDATGLVDGWMRLYAQSQIPMVRVMVDQTLHLLSLAAVAVVMFGG